MQHVFVAGATGHLGRHLCAAFKQRGCYVTALARKTGRTEGLDVDQLVRAEATWPESLTERMAGADLVVSALGLTRPADGLGYWDVDYQGNLNLLKEAQRSGVARFAYVHVLNADRMEAVPRVAAKSAFVRKLQSAKIASTVMAPTACFSSTDGLLAQARSGRVWMFGSGQPRINPIHGADLASATCEAAAAGVPWVDIGGPETFTRNDLARLCFEALGAQARITHLPEGLRRVVLWGLPRVAPRRVAGPAQFALVASGMNMTAPAMGRRLLRAYLRARVGAG
jgi:uncharacterized protein YbjT (DUF2867 family)